MEKTDGVVIGSPVDSAHFAEPSNKFLVGSESSIMREVTELHIEPRGTLNKVGEAVTVSKSISMINAWIQIMLSCYFL